MRPHVKRLGTSLTNVDTPFLVQHHVTKDGELLAKPWARALASLLLDILDQFHMTSEISSVPERTLES